jgi:hypothetical protein
MSKTNSGSTSDPLPPSQDSRGNGKRKREPYRRDGPNGDPLAVSPRHRNVQSPISPPATHNTRRRLLSAGRRNAFYGSRNSDSAPTPLLSPDNSPQIDVSSPRRTMPLLSHSSSPVSPAPTNQSSQDSRDMYRDVFSRLPLLPVCGDWNSAFFFLAGCDFSLLREQQIRTIDFIPHGAQKLFRDSYHAVLHAIAGVTQIDIPDSDYDTDILRTNIQNVLRRLLLALPAMLLTYEFQKGPVSRLESVRGRCHQFLDGQWETLYASALAAFRPKRPRTLDPDPDRKQQCRNRQALILAKKGNFTKAYKALTQDGLCQTDTIHALRSMHRTNDLSSLNTHGSLLQHVQTSTNWHDLCTPDDLYKDSRRQKNGKAPDRHGMRPEHFKILMDDPFILDLYYTHIFQPILQGTLHHDDQDSSLGCQLFAVRKSDPDDARPVQNPDNDRARASAVLCRRIFRRKSVQDYFAHGNHGSQADSRLTQRGLSPDGCPFVAKEIQRYAEQENLLKQSSTIDSTTPGIIELDIVTCFPTVERQATLDSLAGTASRDIPSMNLKAGDSLNTPSDFRMCLPLASLLYSQPIQMAHYHPGRSVEYVSFQDGLSQGSPEGSCLTVATIHVCINAALARHPDAPIRVLCIIDDVKILGPLKYSVPFMQDLQLILKDGMNSHLNLKKSSLLLLQLHELPSPRVALDLLYQQLPYLATLPLATAGSVFVGTPVGHPSFINAFLNSLLTVSASEMRKLLQFPFANLYFLLIRYCANNKIQHLA